MTLFLLSAYTTYEVPGFIYGSDKTTVEDNLNDVLDTLDRNNFLITPQICRFSSYFIL